MLTGRLNLSALNDNFNLLQGMTSRQQWLMPALKANAYGHGVQAVAPLLHEAGARMFATGSPFDAQQMRSMGLRQPVLLFACATPALTAELAASGFLVTVTSLEEARAIADKVHRPTPVYIKVDVGLGRLGMSLEEAEDAIRRIVRVPNVRVTGIYTHAPFKNRPGAQAPGNEPAGGYGAGKSWAQARLAGFDELLNSLRGYGIEPEVTQAMASSALLAGLHDSCTAVCIGHALFGLSPFTDENAAADVGLKPVLTHLGAPLIAVRSLARGSDLAIAGRLNLSEPMLTGVVAAGAGDGVPRPGPDQTMHVDINGVRAPVLAVSLEHTTIDLRGVSKAITGDQAYFVSEELSLIETARAVSTSPLTCLTSWSNRWALESD